ncbi:MAG: hypothetical protein HDT42_02940 [Ruminococcaceae bacterium]|nr:hypothetical protein [Oscillospiraceae bacterium]
MEILTLLKANIRRKKGSFVSVILLTLIIAMSVTTILSIRKSAFNGVYQVHEMCETPDIWVGFMARNLTDDMVDKVKNSSNVKSVNVVDSITVSKVFTSENEYNNGMRFVKENNTRLINERLNGIEENVPKLQKGEIYVPLRILMNLDAEVGQKITFRTIAGDYEFTVKGILLDPMFGASTIGFKMVCLSDEDFSEIAAAVSAAETEDKHGLAKNLEIYKSDDCDLSNVQLRRQLNLEMGLTDMGGFSLTNDLTIHYSTMIPEIVCYILLVFIALLLAIVIIVTVHSISVEIETNYVTFGVLKAQGFDKSKIRALFMEQYLLAEIIGAVLGIALSIPLIGVCSNIFVTLTAVPAVMSVPIGIISLILAGVLALSAFSIFFVTIKINKISPVRAISGAKNEIYFDSRLNAPISKNLLSPSLALRQFTSAKRRYAGSFVIVSILVFFMMTVSVLANTVNSKSALESMGTVVSEIDVSPKRKLSDSDREKIEKEIESFAEIEKAYYTNFAYFSFDGESIASNIHKNPSLMLMMKGRAPEYDNEIAATQILLEEFNLKIGDEVTVGWGRNKETYLITGSFQTTNDVGRCFLISADAAERIGYDEPLWGNYSLKNSGDKELNAKIVDSLNEKFGDMIEAEAPGDVLDETLQTVIDAMQIIIYVFSILFSLIVVHMVCSKAFIQERIDIGIFKATGFKTSGLRWQFAFRFLIVAIIGSAAGGLLSLLFSGEMLGLLLKSAGIVSVSTDFGFLTYAIPIAITCLSFLIFSYLASGRIKTVKIRELVTE